VLVKQTGWHCGIELTIANVEYNVGGVNNRDSCMISKKISLRSPFPFIRGYAASVRIARCYTEIKMARILILLLFMAPLSYGNEIDWVKSTVLNDFDSISCEQAKKNIVGILKGSNNIYSQGLATIKPSLIIWETTDSKIKIVAVTASDSCGLIGCYVGSKATWHEITDDLPQTTRV
jgi:hypothetical protein